MLTSHAAFSQPAPADAAKLPLVFLVTSVGLGKGLIQAAEAAPPLKCFAVD